MTRNVLYMHTLGTDIISSSSHVIQIDVRHFLKLTAFTFIMLCGIDETHSVSYHQKGTVMLRTVVPPQCQCAAIISVIITTVFFINNL